MRKTKAFDYDYRDLDTGEDTNEPPEWVDELVDADELDSNEAGFIVGYITDDESDEAW